MTCIVGMIEGTKVWMGGDSIEANSEMHAGRRADVKVFKVGCYLLGCAGSWRALQVLRYQFNPVIPPVNDLHKFMCTDFLSLMGTALHRAGFQQDERGSYPCGDVLVGVAGHLFTIYGASQVAETPYGFAAVGCGSQLAKGALYALTDTDNQRPVRKQLETALRAAAEFQADVRAPFIFEVIGE